MPDLPDNCPDCGLPFGRDSGECDWPVALDGGLACARRALGKADNIGNTGIVLAAAEPAAEPAPPNPTSEDLARIRVLWRRHDGGMALYGIPYPMRPGQNPRHLWDAGNTKDWIWLGQPGWWGSMPKSEITATVTFLAELPAAVPVSPGEWCDLKEWREFYAEYRIFEARKLFEEF